MTVHALTGSDTTSQLAGIGKHMLRRVLTKHPELLKNLGKVKYPSDPVISNWNAEAFVCKLYNPVTELKCIQKLSLLFCKAKKSLELLPPTKGALHLHIPRANFQSKFGESSYALPIDDSPRENWLVFSRQYKSHSKGKAFSQ